MYIITKTSIIKYMNTQKKLPFDHYLFMDVDGTMTDGKIYISNEGGIFKGFNVKDGYAITNLCKKAGIVPVVVTGRNDLCTERRMLELKIEFYYKDINDKRDFVSKWIEHEKADYGYCSYLGDDIPDFGVMELIKNNGGETGSPFDSSIGILKVSSYICKEKGGFGAVREFVEHLIEKWELD